MLNGHMPPRLSTGRPGTARGSALQLAVLMIFLVVTIAGAMLAITMSGYAMTEHSRSQLNALYVAESGIKDSIRQMNAAAADDARDVTPWPYNDGDVFTDDYQWGSYAVVANEVAGTENWRLTSTGTVSHAGRGDASRVVEVVLEAVTKPRNASRFGYALFSDEDLRLNGNGFTDSFDSRLGPYSPSAPIAPFTEPYQGTNGNIGSNGDILNPAGGSELHGDINPGHDNTSTIGGTQDPANETEPLTSYQTLDPIPPAEWQAAQATNDNAGITPASTYDASTMTLTVGSRSQVQLGNPAGTGNPPFVYFFNGVSTSGSGIKIDIVGPAVIYIDGDWIQNGSSQINSTGPPTDLLIYGVGGPHQMTVNGASGFGAGIYAPGHDITFNGSGDMRGSYVANRITRNGGWNFHYDEALGDIGGGPTTPVRIGFDVLGWHDHGPGN